MHVDECGAPERMAGVKLLTVPTDDGKLTPERRSPLGGGRGDEHRVQPRVVSITAGDRARHRLHARGDPRDRRRRPRARDVPPRRRRPPRQRRGRRSTLPLRALTTDAGVDVLSFGGTKNGPPARRRGRLPAPRARGDLRVHPQAARPARLEDALPRRPVRRPPRRRPVAAQRLPRQRDGRAASPRRSRGSTAPSSPTPWRRTASSSRSRRRRSSACATRFPAELPFYVWDEDAGTIRLMCSWDTTDEDVDGFGGRRLGARR